MVIFSHSNQTFRKFTQKTYKSKRNLHKNKRAKIKQWDYKDIRKLRNKDIWNKLSLKEILNQDKL
jgi:hypothetical protein